MAKGKRHEKGSHHHHHQGSDDVMDVPGARAGDPSSAGLGPTEESEHEIQTNRTGYINKVHQLRQVTELAENENDKHLDFTENYFAKCSHDDGEIPCVNGAAILNTGILLLLHGISKTKCDLFVLVCTKSKLICTMWIAWKEVMQN